MTTYKRTIEVPVVTEADLLIIGHHIVDRYGIELIDTPEAAERFARTVFEKTRDTPNETITETLSVKRFGRLWVVTFECSD